MGFNVGATKLRQAWDGQVRRHVRVALVRLMKDCGYRDIYADGAEMAGPVPARSVVIYRYYDSADPDLGGGKVLSITAAAEGLRDLIHQLRTQVCGTDAQALQHFKVHLVAHSMGAWCAAAFAERRHQHAGRPRAGQQSVHLRHATQRHRDGGPQRAPRCWACGT